MHGILNNINNCRGLSQNAICTGKQTKSNNCFLMEMYTHLIWCRIMYTTFVSTFSLNLNRFTYVQSELCGLLPPTRFAFYRFLLDFKSFRQKQHIWFPFSLCARNAPSLLHPLVCNYIPLLHSEWQHQTGFNEQIQGQHHRHEPHRQQPSAKHSASAQHLHQPTQTPL